MTCSDNLSLQTLTLMRESACCLSTVAQSYLLSGCSCKTATARKTLCSSNQQTNEMQQIEMQHLVPVMACRHGLTCKCRSLMRKGRVRSAYCWALCSGKPSEYQDMRQSTLGHSLIGAFKISCIHKEGRKGVILNGHMVVCMGLHTKSIHLHWVTLQSQYL
jgi:hypothetical protein